MKLNFFWFGWVWLNSNNICLYYNNIFFQKQDIPVVEHNHFWTVKITRVEHPTCLPSRDLNLSGPFQNWLTPISLVFSVHLWNGKGWIFENLLDSWWTIWMEPFEVRICFPDLFPGFVSRICFSDLFPRFASRICFPDLFPRFVSWICFPDLFRSCIESIKVWIDNSRILTNPWIHDTNPQVHDSLIWVSQF